MLHTLSPLSASLLTFFFCAVQHCSRILAFNLPPNPLRQLGLHLDRSVTIQPRQRHISSMSNTLEDLTTKVRSHIQHVAFGPVERTMWPSLSRLGGKYFFQSSLTRCSARRTSCREGNGRCHDGGPDVEPLFELRKRTPLGDD